MLLTLRKFSNDLTVTDLTVTMYKVTVKSKGYLLLLGLYQSLAKIYFSKSNMYFHHKVLWIWNISEIALEMKTNQNWMFNKYLKVLTSIENEQISFTNFIFFVSTSPSSLVKSPKAYFQNATRQIWKMTFFRFFYLI